MDLCWNQCRVIHTSDLTGLILIVKNSPSLTETCKVEIRNSSFGSLDIRSCEATISNCYINAQSNPRNTLISAENSFLMLKNCEFHRFKSQHAPTILHGSDNTQVHIDRTWIHQNHAMFGAIFLHDNCSIYANKIRISHSHVFEKGFPAFVLQRNVQANITHSEFYNNTGHFGGAVMLQNKTKTFIHKSTFINNTAVEGGAVFGNLSATLSITDSYFNYNSATGKGGALALRNGISCDLFHCEFTHNTAEKGGAVYTENVIHFQSTVFNNRTAQEGAAVFSECNSSLEVNNSKFIQNKANEYGGAIVIQNNATANFLDSYFSENTAIIGGAIFISTKIFCQLTKCHFEDNSAKQGGALHAQAMIDLQINRSKFQENHAEHAGAIAAYYKMSLSINGTLFLQNRANMSGGCLIVGINANAMITDSVFRQNTANEGGVVSFEENTNAEIWKSEFIGNTGWSEGGALYLKRNVSCGISNSSFVKNTAHAGGSISTSDRIHLLLVKSYFQTNNAKQNGGSLCVRDRSHVEVVESSFTTNTANTGGVIEVDGSTFNFISSNFADNTAYYRGGAMSITSGSVGNISWCNITGNNALLAGALYMWHNVTVHIKFSHFHMNSATACIGCLNVMDTDTRSGGCIQGYGMVEISVFNSSFTENFAENGSVSFIGDKSSINIFGSHFISNKASGIGTISLSGEVNATISHCNFLANTNVVINLEDGASTNISNSNFHRNNAKQIGGVIHGLDRAYVEIRYSSFNENTAHEGGVLNIQLSKLVVLYSNFTGNAAEYVGGAIVLLLGTKANISQSTFVGNKALKGGAIIATRDCMLNLEYCNLTQNHAHKSGGALSFVKGKYESDFTGIENYIRTQNRPTLTIVNSNFIMNIASFVGAVDLSHVYEINILNSTFSNNSANQMAAIALTECGIFYMENVIFLGNVETGYTTSNVRLYLAYIFGITDKVSNIYWLDLKTAGVLTVTGKYEIKLVFKNCSFRQNQAVYAGVSLFIGNVKVTFDGSIFIENTGKYVGVFEAVDGVEVNILNSYFRGNTGTLADIGLLIENSHMNISNITLDGITSTANAFSLGSRRNSSLTVSDSIIRNTTLNSTKHCLFQSSQSSALMFYNVTLENNDFYCTSLISEESFMTINNSAITGNTFRNSFITVSDYSVLELHDSIIMQNIITGSEDHRDAGYSFFILQENSRVKGDHCEIKGNTATYGSIYCEGQGLINMSHSVFVHNKALFSGGVLFSKNCTIVVQNSHVTGNEARHKGGAITSVDGVLWVCMSFFSVKKN